MQQESELRAVTAERPEWFEKALAVPRREGVVDIDGCPISYMEWGDPQSPGIIMIPGLLTTLRCYAFIAPLLADDYHLVVFDLSGQGDSGQREDYPEAARVQEVMGVARHTGLFDQDEKPFIIAHSYGATIGLAVLETFSERFGGSIILDMMTMREDRVKRFRSKRIVGIKKPHRVNEDLEAVVAKFRLGPPQPCENTFLLQYIASHSYREVDGGWIWKFATNIYNNDYRTDEWWADQPHRLVRTPGRKVVIHGGLSRLFNQDSIEYLLELGGTDIPFIKLPEAHHHLMLDQPLALVAAIRSVLALWRISRNP
ncbi:MAG: alpha/beta hydrolase [Gammaproteobacteria bacterium]|jgi:pimeloyl-ACP methyl ester carboxylesterase|nr:alpha/beta hydrolase [Gammaproteobacteria bacterium]MBT4491704.1 alpha/beta hydrolase [Gammaproteobacteria bacterium]MBT7371673.1 alpha/beta hydrolase [Gammaproteobacteria bacterium]